MPSSRRSSSPINLPVKKPRRDNIVPEAGQDAYRLAKHYPEPTACSVCGAVYRDGRWTWAAKAGTPNPLATTVCPACRRIQDSFYAGELVVSGAFVATHKADILAMLRAEAEVEGQEHPLHRIGAMDEQEAGIVVRTTDVHLARRLGEALSAGFEGSLDVKYPKDAETVRVAWNRDDPHPPMVAPAKLEIPVEILATGFAMTADVEGYVSERLGRLGRFHQRMLSCRVTIEAPERHHRQGGPYAVSLKIEVPGPDIVVNRQQAGDLHVAIRGAFDAAQRQLEDLVRRMRAEEPRVDDRNWARVLRVFGDQGYGFLQAEDGHEVYFHRNSVLGGRFADLEPGDQVRFSEEAGEQGAQATSVIP